MSHVPCYSLIFISMLLEYLIVKYFEFFIFSDKYFINILIEVLFNCLLFSSCPVNFLCVGFPWADFFFYKFVLVDDFNNLIEMF